MRRITGTTTISIAHVEVAISDFSAAPTAPLGSSTSSPQPDSEASAPIAPNHDKLLKAFLFITFASKMYRAPSKPTDDRLAEALASYGRRTR
ncbi:hypothetical protein X963_4210 [Burkholderia pseudomallei MSHR7498]|nr:hypothetical protein DO72_4201 [Burkholderia pseudomallei]KGS54022.1 hypothetical protein X949_5467 [Burkholderia pseudomallei MSHR5609]KGS86372.1 hypothetical protein X976_5713 [Burkholderia pseudomallei MSHR7500]KGS93847.1 hypothetical protein X963_4210 [Burkholderia pseudomallei MSHR7498]KGX54650.1 hypothetical protein Y025_4324 [Burkholderia pseudomallei TSV32]KGX55114.1 hypothetical protein Y024_4884 [Burkholderia pseudomallei TSV44]